VEKLLFVCHDCDSTTWDVSKRQDVTERHS
jgi:hypothetical protein